MIKNQISIDEVIEFLNSLLIYDRQAIQNLINIRVFCNKELAEHPTIQTLKEEGYYYVGMVGILNGLFGIRENGFGTLAAIYAVDCPNKCEVPKEKTIEDFCNICGKQLVLGKLLCFQRTDKWI